MYNLLSCAESVDEELESDGTNTAQVPLYSKLVGLKMQLAIRGSVTTPGVIRWMLCKNVDGERAAADFMTFFHSSNDTNPAREVRGLTLAKGFIMVNESSGVTSMRIFVKRQTLKRLGSLRENDTIVLVLANSNAPATNPTLSGFGTLYCRLN